MRTVANNITMGRNQSVAAARRGGVQHGETIQVGTSNTRVDTSLAGQAKVSSALLRLIYGSRPILTAGLVENTSPDAHVGSI